MGFERSRPQPRVPMKKKLILAVASIALVGCGTQTGDRMASGAAIGAGTGAVFGGVGALPGAIIGGAAGALTPSEKVNLGKPAWE